MYNSIKFNACCKQYATQFSVIEKISFEQELLSLLNAIPVQRNKGIDGFIQDENGSNLIPVKIQKESETLDDALDSLERAVKDKKFSVKILIQTNEMYSKSLFAKTTDVKIVKYVNLQIKNLIKESI